VTRRIHPRHVTERLDLEVFTESGWLGTWADPQPVRCQVEYQRKLVDAAGSVSAVAILVARVPPNPAGDMVTVPLGSRVIFDGQSSWVTSSRPVLRQGLMVYLELTTGDRLARFGGTWPVDVIHHRSAGRDRWGDPTPATDEPLSGWLIGPGTSTEDVDLAETAETTATLYGPPGHSFAATDSVTVIGSPMAGEWVLTGEPAYYPDRTQVPLRRSQ
jgi:hypothetical protein